MDAESLFQDLERRVEELGFELVDVERAGNERRPIIRLRVDRPGGGAEEGTGVSLEDCVRVSRGLEPHLDELEGLSPQYVLEVSSPGVERPLVRPRDWTRFAGSEVAVKGRGTLAERASRLQGTLLGLSRTEGEDEDHVGLRLPDGEEVRFPLSAVKAANLVYQWGGKGRTR